MDDKAGGMAVFSFFELTTVFQMRIEQLTPRCSCAGMHRGTPDGSAPRRKHPRTAARRRMLLKFCHGAGNAAATIAIFATRLGTSARLLKDYAERAVKILTY